MTGVTDSSGLSILYRYDAAGNRTAMVIPEGKTLAYVYDANNRLAELTHELERFTFAHDAAGRRTGLSLPNGTHTAYSYDRNSRLIRLTLKNARNHTLDAIGYTHDAVGNRVTLEGKRNYRYTYDALYRLTKATPRSGGPKETYTYDSVGNRQTGPDRQDRYVYDEGHRLISDGDHQYIYDQNGNLFSKTGKDPHARVTTYSYDGENHLVKLEMRLGRNVKEVSFAYDPFGRRISKTVHREEIDEDGDEEDRTCPRTTYYVYDDRNILMEYNREGKATARYIHGPAIDEPLAVQRKRHGYYYHADGLGSITGLTDAKGHMVHRYEYDSFGNIRHAGVQPFTYTGREYDRETGLYYYRARYYDPKIGRFITKDPIGFAGGDVNLYAYVQNNPVNWIDPLGLDWFRPNADPYVVGRENSRLVEPGKRIGKFVDDYVPAGHTFGTLHDDLVDMGRGAGLPDGLINIPTMLGMYVLAVGLELDNSLYKLFRKKPLLVCH